ncbi:unnamed protein product [Oikopleura dioica]|uniref:Uncharacterized protein n=1 Tax=Oikopleura dioica TaxID=34765 RepID=E4Y0M5_OIKDI|nr:unnamed protein product [Oikopleura dioica]
MKEKELSHHEILNKWIDLDSMIPKKCSDAHTMWKKIVEEKDFCEKSWEEQMRIKNEKASILFTKYNDSWEKGYQDSYPCKQPLELVHCEQVTKIQNNAPNKK